MASRFPSGASHPFSVLWALFTSVVLLLPAAAVAGTITVPGDELTIQAAVDAANPSGDTIVVSPGTYPENVVIAGKDVVLRSVAPADPAIVRATIIDGGAAATVVAVVDPVTSACEVAGLTIANGSAQAGGGIHAGDTLVSIRANVIVGNYAVNGAGVYRCNGTIEGNFILYNEAQINGGGLMYCHGLIRNNLVARNTAQSYGGGLYSCDAAIENNTIAYNRVTDALGRGGGLSSSCGGCGASITNCVFWGNFAFTAPHLHNTVWPTYSCIGDGTHGISTNIALDPRFVDSAQDDFRLRPSSPCIDAGFDTGLTLDFEGDPRPYGAGIDMGADEAITHALTTAVLGIGSVLPYPGTRLYLDGATVEVTAASFLGWQFSHWEGPATGSQNPLPVVMDQDKSVTAVFTPITSPDDPNGDGSQPSDQAFQCCADPATTETNGAGIPYGCGVVLALLWMAGRRTRR